MRFTGLDNFAGTRLDRSLPAPGSGVQMIQNCWYSSLGSIQFARVFGGTPKDPAWAPSRRPPNRPFGTLIVFPVIGRISCHTAGAPVTIDRGSILVMPPGHYEPIQCLDDQTVYGVIETEPGPVAPKHDHRFVVRGIPQGDVPYIGRKLRRQKLLSPLQASGVNSARHHLLGTGARVHAVTVQGHTLLVCLGGDIDVTLSKGGRSATRTIHTGSRVSTSPEYRFALRNISPDRQPAQVLQFSFTPTR